MKCSSAVERPHTPALTIPHLLPFTVSDFLMGNYGIHWNVLTLYWCVCVLTEFSWTL